MTSVQEQLTGEVRVVDGTAVVAVAGEIDILTAAHFRDLVDQAVTVDARSVIIDMAGVEFMDAGGLSVLVAAAARLRSAGSDFAVRNASSRIYRLFEATDLTEALRVERPPDHAALVRGLTEVARIPLGRDVLDAALKLVVVMAQAVVVGADGVSITLPRHGRLGTVAASNDVVLEMDHDQYDTGEGPCLDAATLGERFHIHSLGEDDRWPAFVPRARARGIESILSTPLLTGNLPIGALNVYSCTAGAFAVHELEWADQFAAEAATVVSSALLAPSVDSLSQQIQQALQSREVIALAQGMVMHRDSISHTAAHAVLRDVSRRTGRPLRDVCDQLVGYSASNRGTADGGAHVQPTG